jgi:hypothetical protein
MATGAKNGLNPARTDGSGPDNKGMREYTLPDGFASDIGLGDILILNAGQIDKGDDGDTANAIGVFMGVEYVKADGQPTNAPFWPGGTNTGDGNDPLVKVLADPRASFTAKGNASVAAVQAGQIYSMTDSAATATFPITVDTAIGRSNGEVDITAGAIAAADSIDVEVLKVIDADNDVLEVRLALHALDR